jgi:PIN domain nuclease of toxin-antitoxin system
MSPILLDTHAAIWAAAGRLKPAVAREVTGAAERGELLLSPITAWEIGTLARKGRLPPAFPATQYVTDLFSQPGVLAASFTPSIALAATALPGQFRGDSADCILIATAIAYGARFVTHDRAILKYASMTRHVQCIPC